MKSFEQYVERVRTAQVIVLAHYFFARSPVHDGMIDRCTFERTLCTLMSNSELHHALHRPPNETMGCVLWRGRVWIMLTLPSRFLCTEMLEGSRCVTQEIAPFTAGRGPAVLEEFSRKIVFSRGRAAEVSRETN